MKRLFSGIIPQTAHCIAKLFGFKKSSRVKKEVKEDGGGNEGVEVGAKKFGEGILAYSIGFVIGFFCTTFLLNAACYISHFLIIKSKIASTTPTIIPTYILPVFSGF